MIMMNRGGDLAMRDGKRKKTDDLFSQVARELHFPPQRPNILRIVRKCVKSRAFCCTAARACSPPPSEPARNLTMPKILHIEVEEIPWNKDGANSSHGNAW